MEQDEVKGIDNIIVRTIGLTGLHDIKAYIKLTWERLEKSLKKVK